MFPFWEPVIAPILEAAEVGRVLEIGALRGENTVQMLEDLGATTELHVVDPVPAFDPADHEARFPGRYVFHQALSLEVLPKLPPMDAALIDGDHNWYTVFNECRQLAEVSRSAGASLPILMFHDVGWPYGRRDLYYAPEQIPAEFRQPHARQGMAPNRSKLKPRGGLNPSMWNATHEGGPRNGVMTAVDDFVAGHDRPLRVIVLPLYFGLAIVVEEQLLEAKPRLRAALDRLETAGVKDQLIALGETMRLRSMIFQHGIVTQRDEDLERLAHRYLAVLKGSLLNEHYLENEARLATLTRAATRAQPVDAEQLRDPERYDKDAFARLRQTRTVGLSADREAQGAFVPYTDMGRLRLDHLERVLDEVRTAEIPGDVAECGTGRGGGALFARGYLEAWEIEDRLVWVADRFRASVPPALRPELTTSLDDLQPDLNMVRDGFARFDLLDDRVRFLQGPLTSTLPDAAITDLAVLRISGRLGSEVGDALDHLYERVVDGGFVLVDAGGTPGARDAVDAFRARRGIATPIEQVDAGLVQWRKAGGEASVKRSEPSAAPVRAHPPLAPDAPAEAIDLTVVVVFYNMAREAPRTLHALSRSYQLGLDDRSYEVIVVENGSDPDQRLGEDFVHSFGPEFRYIDMADRAEPSPVAALNEGIRAGRGDVFALMIDGAHIVTPGVLRYGLLGISSYRPAIVATQQWYVGPGQQGDAMDSGYDQAYEDRLFEGIEWPSNGYRLFDISHFVGDRDWFDGLWESNCLFASRRLLQQAGGFDESFSIAGGGYANLDLYERLGSTAGVRVVTMLGEGSFHQVHGGTTTNQGDHEERRRRVFSYGQQFADLHGRPFRGPGKPIHYVGAMTTTSARRTKARRMGAEAFVRGPAAHGPDGRPEEPTPVADELKVGFVDAVWNNLPWRRTSWLGRRVVNAPTDLLAYQEIIASTKPGWIIETSTGSGARALFLASMCDLTGHGQVLSIDHRTVEDRPQHPRITYLLGRPTEEHIVAAVRERVGPNPNAFVILGSRANRRGTIKEFETYRDLVAPGGYVVVEDTIVNGHPVWPGFGPGPAEGVKGILNRDGDFVADPTMEKYSLTFNPGGFLKRVR